jgi:hypothetical protein
MQKQPTNWDCGVCINLKIDLGDNYLYNSPCSCRAGQAVRAFYLMKTQTLKSKTNLGPDTGT